MTPAEQLDIIRSFEEVESMDDDDVSKRDLEVSHDRESNKFVIFVMMVDTDLLCISHSWQLIIKNTLIIIYVKNQIFIALE